MLAVTPSTSFRRTYGIRGFGDIPYKPVQYCNLPGVGLTACPGQDLQAIQDYNFQLETDTNNALNQKNCNDAWVLNGRVGPNNCASMYPVSGQTTVAPPTTPSVTATTNVPVRTATTQVVQGGSVATVVNTRQTANAAASTNSAPDTSGSTSTNVGNQQETSGPGGIGLTGLEVIIGIVGIGLTFYMMQKGHM